MDANIILESTSTLRAKIGSEKVLTDECIRAAYNHDISMYIYDYSIPSIVILPETVDDVREIILEANRLHIPVVPLGANTFGNGNVETYGGIIVDLGKMNKILEIDEKNMTFTVEAGANLHAVNRVLKKKGYCYPTYPLCFGPITFGAEVSKNSGGEVGSMYGHVAKRLIGLEVVLGTGDVIVTGSSNVLEGTPHFIQSGLPDLTSLFVSAEGAYGIITKVTMQMQLVPVAVDGADIKFEATMDGFRAACDFVADLRNRKGLISNAHLLDWYSSWLDERFFSGQSDISDEAGEDARIRNGHTILLEFDGFTSAEECEGKKKEALIIAEKYGGVYSGTMLYDIFSRAEQGDVSLTEIVYAGGYAGTMIISDTPYEKMPLLYELWLKNLDKLGLPKAYSSAIIAMGDDGCIPFYYPWHPRREETTEEEWNETIDKWRKLVDMTFESAMSIGTIPYRVSRNWRPYILGKLEKGYLTYIRKMKDVFDPNNIMNPGVSVFEEASL